jgi:hypothetical protein
MLYSSLQDGDMIPHAGGLASLSAADRQEYLDEINGEVALHLSILYFFAEIFRGDEKWGEELSA